MSIRDTCREYLGKGFTSKLVGRAYGTFDTSLRIIFHGLKSMVSTSSAPMELELFGTRPANGNLLPAEPAYHIMFFSHLKSTVP